MQCKCVSAINLVKLEAELMTSTIVKITIIIVDCRLIDNKTTCNVISREIKLKLEK